MKKLLVAALLLVAVPAFAAPPTWSVQRASIVVTAQGASLNQQTPIFLPAVGLSYSLTSQMSLIGDAGHDFAGGASISRLGARFHVADFGQGAVGLGVNYCFYRDLPVEHQESWSASAHGEWPVARWKNGATALWVVGSAERDPANELSTLRLGLRAQVIGGVPR